MPRPGPGYGYAAASRKGLPWPILGAAVAVVLVLGVATWRTLGSGDEPEIEPLPTAESPVDVEPEEAPPEDDLDTAPPADDEPEAGEERTLDSDDPAVSLERMEPWMEDYAQTMGPLGATLDEIDFDGIEPSRCQDLGRHLSIARRQLQDAPDREIGQLVQEGLGAFNEAYKGCRSRDENAWALGLLNGKAATHEAQVLMDERYLYRGVLELELESENGVERSTESISGRFLASSLP